MKFTVARKEFADALKIVLKAVAVKTVTPILSGIYFSASGSQLELQGTDYSIGISAKIGANVEEDGEIVLLGKKCFELVQKLSGDTVTVSTAENQAVEILGDKTKYSLLTMVAEDFPRIKHEENLQTFHFRQSDFKNIIRRTAFAAGDSSFDSRQIFQGVLFHCHDGILTFVATNTHRIALVNEKVAGIADEEKFIVPAKILKDISALLNDERTIEVFFSDKMANFIFDNIFVTARLIAGTFSDYNKVFPAETPIKVTVSPQEFLNALERVSVIAKDNEYETVQLHIDDDGINISAVSPDIGKAEENVSAEVSGGELDIHFNYNYLIDALKVIEDEKISIGLSKPLNPADFQTENLRYVVTPVRRN